LAATRQGRHTAAPCSAAAWPAEHNIRHIACSVQLAGHSREGSWCHCSSSDIASHAPVLPQCWTKDWLWLADGVDIRGRV
jgi:hypothetical protein